MLSKLVVPIAHHRPGPYGGSVGATPLFEDTSTDQLQGMPGGYSQYPGNEFLQGPMANVAATYGKAVASQGREYVEKHVSAMIFLTATAFNY